MAAFNVAYLAVAWPAVIYGRARGMHPAVWWTNVAAYLMVAGSFGWWCERRGKRWLSWRSVVRARRRQAKVLKALHRGLRARRLLKRNPAVDYFSGLIAAECLRRGESLAGFFDEWGHFVMEPVTDDAIYVVVGGEDHPADDKADDLDNSWEPPSCPDVP